MSKQHTARFIAALSFFSLFVATSSPTDAETKNSNKKRTPWKTSTVKGSPDAPLPYISQRAFPGLKFTGCLDMAQEPGTNRFFVAEQAGKILSFPMRKDVKKADLVIDLKKQIKGCRALYAITFHPDYEKNGYIYVCYLASPVKNGSVIARFTVKKANPPTIDVKSELQIIRWISGGHNGCCLKFGPDGYLYISTGDAAPANPPDSSYKTGQDISDLLSSILRIDVDKPATGKSYRIPSDNPFTKLKGARGEVWAYGFRNPWRMSFDRKTGDLWVGDVGWELFEMLDRVVSGGNYGWAVTEGNSMTHPEWPRGPTPILDPTIQHPHSESSSITDGLTYYGTRLKGLTGHHVYGDYDTGKLWSFRFVDNKVVEHREVADTTLRVVGFADTRDGDFYILDHTGGTLHRLIDNPRRNETSTFPRKLSKSGLFSSVTQQSPAAGVIPYTINAEPWADHAVARRFVAVPQQLTVSPGSPAWSFPKDSVLVKTLSLDMVTGDPKTRRRIETQILHFDGGEWQPYTYRWNKDQTDAVLLGARGGQSVLDIKDSQAPGGKRKQTWRFTGRAECQRCHNKWSGPPLAFNAAQLNTPHNFGGAKVSQVDVLHRIGLLKAPIAKKSRPKLADPTDSGAKLSARARSYLQVNCAHCHRLHAGGAVLSKMHFDVPIKATNMVGWRPTQGTFGIHSAQVVAAGDPYRSVLLYRVSKLGSGRMPRLGSTVVDRNGTKLLHDWIANIGKDISKDKSNDTIAKKLRDGDLAGLQRLVKSKAKVAQGKEVNRLLASTSGAMLLLNGIGNKSVPAAIRQLAVAQASKHQDVQIRDLFERFLPDEKRIKRLGAVIRPRQILSLQGSKERGKQIFFKTSGVQCKNCHQINKQGKEVGPELTKIGKKYNRRQLLESILEPSKKIDPKFVTYLIETDAGRLHTGLLVRKNAKEVVLRSPENKLIQVPAKKVEQLVPQRKSLMPELLLRDMTAQQVADLLAYMSSLK